MISLIHHAARAAGRPGPRVTVTPGRPAADFRRVPAPGSVPSSRAAPRAESRPPPVPAGLGTLTRSHGTLSRVTHRLESDS
eukprot:757247-Hanusia_phi.AAC.2